MRVIVEYALRLLCRGEEPREDGRGLLPLASFFCNLLTSSTRQLVILGLTVIIRDSPFGFDIALLLQLEQCRINRAVVDRELVAARLLNAPRNAVAVQRPHRFQCL